MTRSVAYARYYADFPLDRVPDHGINYFEGDRMWAAGKVCRVQHGYGLRDIDLVIRPCSTLNDDAPFSLEIRKWR